MKQKSELEKWLDKYYEVFGRNYPLMITSTMNDAEIIADIRAAIKTNRAASGPEYIEGADY